MTKRRFLMFGSAALVSATLAVTAAQVGAQRPELRMLGDLAPGRWELRWRGEPGRVERLCLGDRRRLVQLRHPNLPCDRIILEDGPSSITVQYICRGRGYGRTHIRRENGQLIQLETQGIADGLPFEMVAEGRRVGECAS